MEESLVSTNDNGKSKWFQIFARLTQRQWILSILFAAINLLGALPVALQAPFYPAEVGFLELQVDMLKIIKLKICINIYIRRSAKGPLLQNTA